MLLAILTIVFSSCKFALNRDTDDRSIPDKLEYRKITTMNKKKN